jgi:outer membrane protein
MGGKSGLVRGAFSLLAAWTVLGWSSTGRADPPLKIGYFDVKQILAEADEAGEVKKKLQADFDKKQKELDELKDEIETKGKDLQAKQAILSPSALQEAQGELNKKVQDAQQRYLKLQNELQSSEQQAIGELISKLTPIVHKLAADEGYTYIFEKTDSGLFLGPPEHDLTTELLRKLNSDYHSRKTKGSTPK